MAPALVIFDCDGVLVDTEPVFQRILAADLTRRGLEITPEETSRRFAGQPMATTREWAIGEGVDLPEDWASTIYVDVWAAFREGVAPIAGAAAALDALDAAGVPHCVASNGQMAQMEITLGAAGFWERLQGRIFSAYDVGAHKPDPGLFLHAAEAMGAVPADCVVVEDSATGARAARAAGMRCLGYAASDQVEALSAEGAEIFHDMRLAPRLAGLVPA